MITTCEVGVAKFTINEIYRQNDFLKIISGV